MAAALQWNVASAYIIAPIATNVNSPALMRPTRSPKFNSPIARLPRITVKLSHERKVLSLAKNTCYTNIALDHVMDENGCSSSLPLARHGWEGQCAFRGHSGGGVGTTWRVLVWIREFLGSLKRGKIFYLVVCWVRCYEFGSQLRLIGEKIV